MVLHSIGRIEAEVDHIMAATTDFDGTRRRTRSIIPPLLEATLPQRGVLR